METSFKKGHSREFYAQIKKSRGFSSKRPINIKDRYGKELSHPNDIIDRWKEYTELLYNDDSELFQFNGAKEPNILLGEVEWALKQLPNNKSPGIDNIPGEMLKSIPIKRLLYYVKKFGKLMNGLSIRKNQYSYLFTKKEIVKIMQIIEQLP